ncbi:hypothetical protein [Sulfurisphaera ohwakuensis]|uniref:Uncharacterized protein n=1 Tax=Sulfurisphaera ohwakuensis TaxID=69656 RepID=A0A650CJI8_SULOH|nr:hypothetical protein [Sulfurisphaera ohwakuensis]MBB5254008.1 hypothetical protein [Sulfurisphaera ohwakuensis]QGR17888.1 hypothetical protein D1869_12420 [Sulfurisphaera ohwakuensis]
MPWVSAKSADRLVYMQIVKLPFGKRLRVESFKGDRWIEIVKIDENNYKIIEHGFNNNVYNVTENDLKRILKELFGVEFPRSHQLRIVITS